MSEARLGPLARFRQPEYTGENRCLPCTVINLGIAAAASVAVGLAVPVVGVGVFLAAVAVIGVRGYLIPGTPTLTARYLPESVHRALGHDDPVTAEPIAFDVEASLKSAEIVTECADVDDLCLTDRYRAALREEIETLRSESAWTERLAASLSVSPDEVAFDDADHGWFVSIEDTRAGGWDSKAAFLADLANQALLSDRLENWEELPPRDRTRLLAALRSFIEECPDCGGDVVPDENVTRSCCREDVVSVTTTCVDCGATVFKGTGS